VSTHPGTNPDHPSLTVVCPECGAAVGASCRSLGASEAELALGLGVRNVPHAPRGRLASALLTLCPFECACEKCLDGTYSRPNARAVSAIWKRQKGTHRTRYERQLRVRLGERGLVLPGYVQLTRSPSEAQRPWYALAHVDLTYAVEPEGGDLDIDTGDFATAQEALEAAMKALRAVLSLSGGTVEVWPLRVSR